MAATAAGVRDSRDTALESPHCFDIRNLAVSYGDRMALRHVTIRIPARGITAIVGPSGCGKSSFLQSLNRLSDLTPGCRVSGTVLYRGSDIRGKSVNLRQLRRNIGMIFQKPAPFPVSVRDNIVIPLRDHGMSDRQEVERTVRRVLEDVGLWEEVVDRLDVPALTLSGGQQQRLCLARALALDPEVLLMDEPCSALDPIASSVIETLISRLARRVPVVIVTHNLAQARRVADHMAVFWYRDQAGALIEFGPTASLIAHPKTQETAAYIQGLQG